MRHGALPGTMMWVQDLHLRPLRVPSMSQSLFGKYADNHSFVQVGTINDILRMRVKKFCTFRHFKSLVAQSTTAGIPEERQLWLSWKQTTVSNGTAYSPSAVLGREQDDMSMCHCHDTDVSSENWTTSLNLMLLVTPNSFRASVIDWSSTADTAWLGLLQIEFDRACILSKIDGREVNCFLSRRQPQACGFEIIYRSSIDFAHVKL